MAYLCLDIGATKTLVGILEEEFKSIEEIETKNFLRDREEKIREWSQIENFDEVAVATAGPIGEEGRTIRPPNLPQDEIPIGEEFQEFFDKVEVINDCHAGALGEYVYGSAKTEHLVYLTMSTGIGAGVIDEGELVQGWNGNFAEVGHMKISDHGECGCGAVGHWEALCSGKNLPKIAESMVGERFDKAEQIFDRYREGNEKLEPLIEKVKEYNAAAISNLINLYNPEHISIGGSVGLNQFDLIIPSSEEKIRKNSINDLPNIEKCSLGEEVVLKGLKALIKKGREGDYREF
ncbi:MAG: ROK family protein [Candidatus Thermoplasmatota archaeon]|nr:ROK family protein [Candidatus Thermoplasmatota archaeon]